MISKEYRSFRSSKNHCSISIFHGDFCMESAKWFNIRAAIPSAIPFELIYFCGTSKAATTVISRAAGWSFSCSCLATREAVTEIRSGWHTPHRLRNSFERDHTTIISAADVIHSLPFDVLRGISAEEKAWRQKKKRGGDREISTIGIT